jgi:2-hydroxy-3-oxopropionate reductase
MAGSVAVVGAGVMGSAIAGRLLQRGHRVFVFDIDAAKVEALVAQGALQAESPSKAARDVSFVITSLNHARIVESAVLGSGGIAEAGTPEKLMIDMSSIDPGETVKIAAALKARCGMRWLDAPLSGGAPGVRDGRLTVMAGGDAADFEAARAVMADLATNYSHMGPIGAGQTTKLVNQLFCAVLFQAVAEAVKLAEAGGVDPALVPAALAGGRADSRILQEFMAKFGARDFSPTGRVDNMLKDLESVQAFAASTRTPLPMTSAVAEINRLLVASGLGAADSAEAMRLLDGTLGRSAG